MEELRIEYVPLSELKRWERNPKDHDLGELGESLKRFGYIMPVLVDERTGVIAAGHGRIDALLQRKELGESPPARVRNGEDDWEVPVIRGVSFNSDGEMAAYAIADNRLTEKGGWLEPVLVDVLADIKQESTLDGIGFDADDLDALAAFTSMMGDWSVPDLEWEEPIKAWRVIVQCSSEEEVIATLEHLGLDASNTRLTRHDFSETVLAH